MLRWIGVFLALLLIVPAFALGDTSAAERHGLVLDQVQLWSLVIGVFTPLVGYVVNSALFKRVKAGIPESVAAMIQAVFAAVGAAVYQAITTSTFGWNDATLQLIVTAVVAAFGAHHMLWKPSGVQSRLVKR